jgi:hypothetical protein
VGFVVVFSVVAQGDEIPLDLNHRGRLNRLNRRDREQVGVARADANHGETWLRTKGRVWLKAAGDGHGSTQ